MTWCAVKSGWHFPAKAAAPAGFVGDGRGDRVVADLLFGERRGPDGTPPGRPRGSGRKAADLYARLLAAESHATAERRRELRVVELDVASQESGRPTATGMILKEGAGIMPGGCGCPRCWWDSLG